MAAVAYSLMVFLLCQCHPLCPSDDQLASLKTPSYLLFSLNTPSTFFHFDFLKSSQERIRYKRDLLGETSVKNKGGRREIRKKYLQITMQVNEKRGERED